MGASHGRWWGRFSIPEREAIRWRIGPLTLWAHRLEWEWRIAWETTGDPLDDSLVIGAPEAPAELLEWDHLLRFGFTHTGGEVHLAPALADRPVVSRPERPFTVPGGESVTLFVSTPLWLRISAGHPLRELVDLPIYRPSDTWFGSSTREGELCYASRATGRLHLDGLPVRPHRATTSVTVVNRLEAPLLLERVNLPIPLLALFAGTDGRLWTPSVTLERTSEHDFAPVRISGAPPREAGPVERVAPPRLPSAESVMVRAFARLFRPR